MGDDTARGVGPAIRFDPEKGPPVFQVRANRSGYGRLAEVFGALAEAAPGSFTEGGADARRAASRLNEAVAPGSFRILECVLDEDLSRDAPPIDATEQTRRDRRWRLGCAGAVLLVAAVLAILVRGVFALWHDLRPV